MEKFRDLRVYATVENLKDCRDELLSVLEDWVLLSIHKNGPVPVIEILE